MLVNISSLSNTGVRDARQCADSNELLNMGGDFGVTTAASSAELHEPPESDGLWDCSRDMASWSKLFRGSYGDD
jgi:hypothetical protein